MVEAAFMALISFCVNGTSSIEKFLSDSKVKYETKGKTKWYEEDRYDIGLNGYAIDVKSNFLDLNSSYIINKLTNLFEDKKNWFLKCHSLVPLDQFNPGSNERRAHKRDKIYIFPFIEGSFSHNTNNSPLIHCLWDYKWLKRAEHKDLPNLGKISIEYSGSIKNASITIYGTTSKNNSCIEKIKLNTGIASIKKELAVFPNPLQDKLYINGLSENQNIWSVYDILGKKVLEANTDENNVVLDLSDLTNGVYFLRSSNYLPVKIIKY